MPPPRLRRIVLQIEVTEGVKGELFTYGRTDGAALQTREGSGRMKEQEAPCEEIHLRAGTIPGNTLVEIVMQTGWPPTQHPPTKLRFQLELPGTAVWRMTVQELVEDGCRKLAAELGSALRVTPPLPRMPGQESSPE